ncbi:MAG TPA: hypothetical protein PLI19_05625 [Erysipelotrichaceae bacterium]|nr:hypothetical protein [Erysipelotrichaceae bacterium]HQB32795.1 hypothetical protein [Erysipelotrichaceae bacterium]
MTPFLVAFGSVAAVYLYVKYRKMKSINHVNETYDGDVYKKYHKRKPFGKNRRHLVRPNDDFTKRKPYSVTLENPKYREKAADENKE